METAHRPSVRVLCVDEHDRILLLRWRDPSTGAYLWEPPGGGIEAGESPLEAARRELREETGLPGDAVAERHVMVRRDVVWNGRHYQGEEAFFLARFAPSPPVVRDGLEAYEVDWLRGHDWTAWDAMTALPDPVEPPQILEVLTALAPHGPWAAAG